MNFIMTRTTNRNNIEPMFGRIVRMVILLRLFAATALKQSGFRHVFSCYCIVYSTLCSTFIGIVFAIFLTGLLAFFRLTIQLVCLPAFFGSAIFFITLPVCLFAFRSSAIFFLVQRCAFFAPRMKAIFMSSGFIKLRSGFNSFAIYASFCLNCLRHFLFLFKRLCLGPIGSTILPVGSLYIKG